MQILGIDELTGNSIVFGDDMLSEETPIHNHLMELFKLIPNAWIVIDNGTSVKIYHPM